MTSVILVVDDERPVREFLARALEELGHRTLEAVNGRQALNVLSHAGHEAPDLIISDVMMPLLGGVELCQAIRSNPDTNRIPVILMSGAPVGGSVEAYADAFIAKPFDLDALDGLVESTLATRHAADTGDLVTLQFRHDQKNSGVSRHGQLHSGGRLRIEYDPARLTPAAGPVKRLTDVVCHVRFQPSGEQLSGALVPQAAPVQPLPGATRPLAVEMRIPTETTRIDVWFEGRSSTETTGWDSRYGQNFTFAVTDQGSPVPERSAILRPNARVDTARIHVVEDAAAIRAQLSGPTASVAVWADVHVFDAMGELLHAATIGLEQNTQTDDASGALRPWHADVYTGSGGAHTINYRLYCQVGDQMFTDGVLHQFEVPTDTEVRAIPGGC